MKTWLYFIRDGMGWHKVGRLRWLRARRSVTRVIAMTPTRSLDGMAFAKLWRLF